MFKGTNKIWKGLALLLVLCMLPTAALADTNVSLSAEATVNEATDSSPATVTVTAEIGVPETDVTILAYRSTTKIEEGSANPAIPPVESNLDETLLQDVVVYIDQETASAANGNGKGDVSFTFIPRNVDAGSGKYINIYVGGTNVTADNLVFEQVELAQAAPVVTAPAKLYKTCNLELGLKQPTGSTVDIAGWYADIAKVEVNGDTIAEGTYSLDNPTDPEALVIDYTAIEGYADGIESVTITGADYADVPNPITTALTWSDKEHGAVTLDKTEGVAPVTVELTVADSAQGGWLDALSADAFSYAEVVNGEVGTYTAFDTDAVNILGTKVELTLPTEATGSKTYKIKIHVNDEYVDYVTDEGEEVKVTSPATDAKDKLSIAVEYSKTSFVFEDDGFSDEAYDAEEFETLDEDEKAAQFGKATITLPATGANETSISWTKDGEPVDSNTALQLDRPASDADATAITYTATISKTVGTVECVETKSFTVKVNPVGAGVSIEEANVTKLTTTAFGISGAKVVTIKLEKNTIDPTTQTIKVGDAEFYYAPERSTGDVDVFVAILRSNNDNAATVADAAEIVDVATENSTKNYIYYGKPSAPYATVAMNNADSARALKLAKLNIEGYSSEYTDAQYLAADVLGSGAITNATTARILKALKPGATKAEFLVITQ